MGYTPTAWTGHVVHFGTTHLLFDILPLLVFCAVLEARLGRRLVALMLALGMPVVSLALWVSLPEMSAYRGASAMVSMLWVCTGLLGLNDSRQAPGFRVASGVLLIVFALKLVFDAYGLSMGASMLPGDVRVAWQAHAWGGGVGLLAAALLLTQGRPLTSFTKKQVVTA